MRWKCTVAYDGTGFNGWQTQPDGNTVQDFIERRLAAIFRGPVRIHGSGRTDAGVHARAQVFHFDGEWPHPPAFLHNALRSGFPEQIQITAVRRVGDRFHARYSATGKRYVYHLYEGYAPPVETRFAWSLKNWRLDLEAVRAAAAPLLGVHDFSSFTAETGNPSAEDPVKDLRRLDVTRRGPRVRITTEASGYLYKMVRSLVGCLVEVGAGRMPADEVPGILEKRRRTIRVPTAPARGLFLDRVFYPRSTGGSAAPSPGGDRRMPS